MKVVIDGIFFQTQQKSGIARVWQALLEEWVKDGFAQNLVVCDRAGIVPKVPGIQYRPVPAYDYSKTDSDRQMLQEVCDREKADLFVSTYYTTPLSTPSIFLAYDMIPEVTGGNLDNPMWREKHYAIRKASSYLSISQSTARDLVKFFPEISPDSITVAHCGVHPHFFPAKPEEIAAFHHKYRITKPYFLIVGDRFGFNGYKNTLIFFQALSKLSSKHGFEVVCTGGSPSLEPQLQAYASETNIHLLQLSDEDLRAAYSGAIALIFTSKYEGFGLPILEAMTCGCPVITCPNSSIPEVAGEAALYINDSDINSLLSALLDVQKPQIRNSLITAGLGQARKFSWSKMAKTVSDAFNKACGYSQVKLTLASPAAQSSSPLSLIDQYQRNPGDASALATIRQIRKQIADTWLSLETLDRVAQAYAGEVGKAHQALLNSGIKDEALTETEQAFIKELAEQVSKGFEEAKSLNHLLAAMLYCRADRLPLKYERAAIPSWFANDYLKFMFAWPNLFQEIGEADNYYRYLHNWLDYVHSNIFSNSTSPLWQNIALFFTQIANFIPLYFTTANLRDIYTKRADIMEFALKQRGFQLDYVFPPRPSDRSKIRLGILNDHFMPQTETFATLPVFEHLDRDQFEIFLYALQVGKHPLEQYCQSRVDKLVALPGDFTAQVQTLRADDLDILFIGTNLTAIHKPTTALALHRLARIQTTSFCSPTTTGIRNIDYYMAGQLTAPLPTYQEQYREQLVNLEGCGFCFHYATESEKPTLQPTRSSLGISEQTTVFISGANFYKILPELRETWAKVLAAVPNSILILYPFGPAWTRSYPATPFINNIYAVLAKYGLDNSRLRVVKQLPSRGDVKEFLQLADIYLDSYPYAGATSLIDPLQVGLPTVVMEGDALRFRQGSAMLRDLELSDLVANSESSYIQLAVNLANNPHLRQQKRQQIQQKIQNSPRCLDSRTYSQAIGKAFQGMFQHWQKGQPLSAYQGEPIAERSLPQTQPDIPSETPLFLRQLVDAVRLYQTDSSTASVISDLRTLRKQFAEFWLSLPPAQLETTYQSQVSEAYRTLLGCGFQHQPMTEDEQVFLHQLTQISKGLVHPQALNALLAAMLYFAPGTMRIPDAKNRLPHWLIDDYQTFFESEGNAGSQSSAVASSSELLTQHVSSHQFLNQLLGCVNLYRIDPSDASVVLELRQMRRQLADFWLAIPSEQLETIYQGNVGKAYQVMLECGFQHEPILETEQVFLQELTETSKGLTHPQAINALLGAMLYFTPGKMRIPDARSRLPKWLIGGYEKVFESAFKDEVSQEKPVQSPPQLVSLTPQFINQLFGCANLYEIDPTAESVAEELRQLRKQLAEFLVGVPGEQLESVYRSDVGKAYQALLKSGITKEPLTEAEKAFLNSVVAELGKGMGTPKAINYVLVALMYCRPGQLQVQDAKTNLPAWLLEDYEHFAKGSVKASVG